MCIRDSTHAAAIDVAAGRVMPDMTVIVTAGRISAVGKSSTLRVPKGAQLSLIHI